MAKTKILVIDDERPIRSTLKEILEFEKFEVDTAEDGEIGLHMITKEKYDLVLCDIKMPKKMEWKSWPKSWRRGLMFL